MAPVNLIKTLAEIADFRSYPASPSRMLRLVNGRLLPRQTEFTHAMGTVSGGTETHMEWANNQYIVGATPDFTQAEQGIELEDDGVSFPTGQAEIYGGGFVCGAQWMMVEGVIRLEGPGQGILAYNRTSSGSFGGRLSIVENGATSMFRWEQRNAGDTGDLTYDFPSLPLTVGSVGEPQYHYFQFWKDLVATPNLRLTVDEDTDTEAYGSVPTSTEGASAIHGVVGRSAFDGDLPPSFTILRWRGVGSNVNDGTTASPWATPTVYAQETYSPNGSSTGSYFDAGADDAYWENLVFPDVVKPHNADLEVRWYTANTIAAGDTSSLFTGGWTQVQNNNPIELSSPQGRYFIFQLRYTPSPTVTLGGAAAYLRNASGVAVRVTFDTEASLPPPSGSDPIPVFLVSEGFSGGTLPIIPDYSAVIEDSFSTVRQEMDWPDVVTFPLATGSRQRYRVGWNALIPADKDTLLDFFDARNGGEEPFDWTTPDLEARTARLVTGTLEAFGVSGGAVYAVSAEFEETFA